MNPGCSCPRATPTPSARARTACLRPRGRTLRGSSSRPTSGTCCSSSTTDQLLGQVLDRLEETGLYDRSLVVVTADHGESFGLPGEGRDIRAPGHAVDIALKPLFVKLPGQHRGKIVRRHVRNIDITPTVARVTGLRPRWRVQGRSLIGAPARRIPGAEGDLRQGGRPRSPWQPGDAPPPHDAVAQAQAEDLRQGGGVRDRTSPRAARHPGRGLAGAAAERPARP